MSQSELENKAEDEEYGSLTASNIARELARRLRAGVTDPATIKASAFALEALASLYDRSCEVIATALANHKST